MKAKLLVLIAATSVLLVAPSAASAGVFLKSWGCTLNQTNNSCSHFFSVDDFVNYPCYSRMVASGGAPYASHKTQLRRDEGGSPGYNYGGTYTSAQTAYSNPAWCEGNGPSYVFGGHIQGFQAGGGSPNRAYTLQLYSGYQ